MIVKTRRFGEVEIEVYEKDGVQIISHSALMTLYLQKKSERKLITTYETLFINETGMTVRCFIKDGDEVVDGFGESNPLSLETEIAKQYPHSMANNRALDNAFLNYLGLEKKVYSSSEISTDGATQVVCENVEKKKESKKSDSKQKVEEKPTKNENKDFAEVKQEELPFPGEPVEKPEESVEKENYGNAVEEIPVEEDNASEDIKDTTGPVAETKSIDDGSDFIIPSGRVAGKHFAEVDEKWINWMLKQVQDYPTLIKNGVTDKRDLFEAFIKYSNANNLWEKYNAKPVSIIVD